MGLLDIFDTDQGRLAMGLLSAAGPSREPLSLGQRVFGAMQGFDQYRGQKAERAAAEEERKRRAAMQELQMQQITAAMKQAQEQRAAQAAAMQKRNSYLDAVNPAAGPAMPVSPASGLSAGLGLDEIKALMPQEAKPKTFTLKPGETVYSETGQRMFGVPDKSEKPPTSVQEFTYAQGNPDFLKFMREMANLKAPRNEVRVDLGQKGFDNTLKLRGDFRSEPVYKAHQEMQSAYSQIQQALKQQSPAGDLAGATKVMKLLDPGSVVRESELGMAMAASGLLDRAQNYAQNIVRGTKLTPTQRADFQRLADALFGESVKLYNSKRSEYQGIAERNQLSVPDVLGPESMYKPTTNPGDLAAAAAEELRRRRGQ